MTGLEVVGLWSSIVVGLIGGTLAVVAIIFTRSVDKQNNTLNQRFTEVLTSINEKSENTERQINTMVFRVVETYLDLRPSGLPQAVEDQGQEQDKGAGSEDASSELRRFMARTNQSLEEIRLRQRVQPPELSSSGSGSTGSPRSPLALFSIDDHVELPDGTQGIVTGFTFIGGESGYRVRLPNGMELSADAKFVRAVPPAEPE